MEQRIIKSIYNIINTNSEYKMHELVKLMADCITESSEERECLLMDLHIIECGYHFNEHYLDKALDLIGGKKMNCDEIVNKFKASGITLPEEVTKEDVSYAYHMFLSDYGKVSVSDSTMLRLVQAYIIDEDYPVKNGKVFAEWKFKYKLYKKYKM